MKPPSVRAEPSPAIALRSPALLGGSLGLVLLLLGWLLRQVLLAVLCGVVVAILLDGVGGVLGARLGVPRRVAVAVLLAGLLAVGVAATLWAGQGFTDYLTHLLAQVQQALQGLQADLEAVPALAPFAPGRLDVQVPLGQLLPSFASALAALMAIGFIGAYLSLAPHRYVDNAALLLPPADRGRMLERVGRSYTGLRTWLVNRLLRSLVLGPVTWLALLALDLPYPLALATALAASAFLPLLGPLLAVALAVILASGHGTSAAAWTVATLLAVQGLVTVAFRPSTPLWPIPAGILVGVQALGWTLTGWMGVVLAAPVTVALTHGARGHLKATGPDPARLADLRDDASEPSGMHDDYGES